MVTRLEALIRRHCHAPSNLAAGSASLPSGVSSFAETMAAWRFFNNSRIEMAELIEPLREYARRQLAATECPFVMLVHDWSKLSYPGHASKLDQARLAHEDDHGYELTTVLAVSSLDGAPLAPLEVHFKTADGILSTRDPAPPDVHHLEQVLPSMEAGRLWNLNGPALHVIDREADSVGHVRVWHASGHWFLVRGHDHRVVTWEGSAWKRHKISQELRKRGDFRHSGEAQYHGKAAQLWVAETEVVLAQPARTMVPVREGAKKKKQVAIPGPPLTLRLIIVQVRDDDGRILATWFLLTNAPITMISAQQLARCYYWRWRIESYFKLLKSHGQQLESWLQETGPAIFRRLLIATMACVTTWQLMADTSPAATELKDILIRLSGRQMKRTQPYTAPALLAGIWSLLVVLACLEQNEFKTIKKLIQEVELPFPIFKGG